MWPEQCSSNSGEASAEAEADITIRVRRGIYRMGDPQMVIKIALAVKRVLVLLKGIAATE